MTATFLLFLKCYSILIPCETCKKNFVYKLQHYPPEEYLSNANDTFFYSYLMHDLVNQHINQTEPGVHKQSPSYDVVKEYYFTNGIKRETFEDPLWKTLYIFATTFRPENAKWFIAFLDCCCKLIPCSTYGNVMKEVVKMQPPHAYLTNHYDAFFYVYIIQNLVNTKLSNTKWECENFDDVKREFFSALTDGCKDCNVLSSH